MDSDKVRLECLLKEPIHLDMNTEYTIGLRGTRTGDDVLDNILLSIHAHMTLNGVGRNIKEIDGSLLATIAGLLPLKVRVTGEDLFGPKSNVHVVTLDIVSEKKKARLTDLIRQFGMPPDWQIRRKLGLKPNQKIPQMSRLQIQSMMEDPAFHMTIWEDDIRRKVINRGEFSFTQVFIKPVGNYEPVITISVDRQVIGITKFGRTQLYAKTIVRPEYAQPYIELVPIPYCSST